MEIKYNIETLEHIIADLSALKGVSIAFLDTDFNYHVLRAKENDYCSILQQDVLLKECCHKSDKEILLKCKESRKLETHICYAGLSDSAMPVIKNGIVAESVGFFNYSYFCKLFKRKTGVSPKNYK